jgi:hypothetical protein
MVLHSSTSIMYNFLKGGSLRSKAEFKKVFFINLIAKLTML